MDAPLPVNPHLRLLRALDEARAAAEEQQRQVEARGEAGLAELVARAAALVPEYRRDYAPELDFGHLDEDQFDRLVALLDANEGCVRRSDHHNGVSYYVVRALRHGVWFRAQRHASRPPAAEAVTEVAVEVEAPVEADPPVVPF